jgi:hypothetical protein
MAKRYTEDQIKKGETWLRSGKFWKDLDKTQPYDLAGHSIAGFLTPDLETGAHVPLTVVIDAVPSTGQYTYTLADAVIQTLDLRKIYKLRLILTFPSTQTLYIECPSVRVMP